MQPKEESTIFFLPYTIWVFVAFIVIPLGFIAYNTRHEVKALRQDFKQFEQNQMKKAVVSDAPTPTATPSVSLTPSPTKRVTPTVGQRTRPATGSGTVR